MPDDPQIIFSKGLILERQGHRDRAVHYYRKACLIYDSLGADTIYTHAINRAACIQAAYGEKAYRKEIKAFGGSTRKMSIKIGTNCQTKTGIYCGITLITGISVIALLHRLRSAKIKKILYGVELED